MLLEEKEGLIGDFTARCAKADLALDDETEGISPSFTVQTKFGLT